MRILLGLGMGLIAGVVQATPFVWGDVPNAAANKCVWDRSGSQLINDVVVDASHGNATYNNRVCKLDVSSAAVGSNTIALTLRDTTSVWGDSPSVPFTFVRPAASPAAANLRLAP